LGADRSAQALWYATHEGEDVTRIRLGFRATRALQGWDWSPNGRRVVFAARSRTGSGYPRLYTIRLDGKHRRALRRGWMPEWSADGRYITYVRPDPDGFPFGGVGRVAVMTRDGTGFRNVSGWDAVSPAHFAPDSRRIVYARGTGTFDVDEWRIVDVAGKDLGIAGPPESTVGGYCWPQWALDGDRLAVVEAGSTPDGSLHARLVTMTTTGTDEQVVFSFPPMGPDPVTGVCEFSWQPG
jgi:hypothetical protein